MLKLPPKFRDGLMRASFVKDDDTPWIIDLWGAIERKFGDDGVAWLGRTDRFYLLARILRRPDVVHPWLYARCREVEVNPDGYLDLWAREHYKSSLITFAGSIQEVINDPEITIGIFSHTKPVARGFLVQIKRELEDNQKLKLLYPEIFWADPKNQAPRWSEEKGLIVKRKGNPKEGTWEAHGLVDGQPTGAHFRLRIYNDVVTQESVSTPDQVKKTTKAWENSEHLGAKGPDGKSRAWHEGTRWSYGDSYEEILQKKMLIPRIYPATEDGTPHGKSVLISEEALAEKRKKAWSFAAQMLQNPAAANTAMFQKAWLKFAEIRPSTLNVYIMVDPARSQKKDSDDTAMAAVGIDAGSNKYLLDGYCHKMSLSERWTVMNNLRKAWLNTPGVQMVRVGYEQYGMQSDIEHFEEMMKREKESFEIIELAWPREGSGSKEDRVERLQPDFYSGKFFLAKQCTREENGRTVLYETRDQVRMRESGQAHRIFKPTYRRDQEGQMYSLNKKFLEQFLTFPFSAKKDLVDAVSRIHDMEPVPPIIVDEKDLEPESYPDAA